MLEVVYTWEIDVNDPLNPEGANRIMETAVTIDRKKYEEYLYRR